MKIIVFILCIFFLVNCKNKSNHTVKNDNKIILTGALENDLNTLIPIGTYKVEILDKIKYNSHFKELAAKYQEAIRKNPDWFIERTKEEKLTGKEMGYHPNLGLTKNEYKEYKELYENGILSENYTSSLESITVKEDKNILSFLAKEKLDILNYIKIDLKKEKIWVDEVVLLYFDSEFSKEKIINEQKTKWEGYKWKYIEADKGNEIDFTEPITNLFSFSFSIGVLENDNSTFIEISCREIIDSETITKIDIPLKIKNN